MVNMGDTLSAQVAVLGSLLIEPNLTGEVLDKVQGSDFLSGKCKQVFYAIRDLFTAGETVDPVTVRGKLGGPTDGDWGRYLMELMEVTPTAANVWEYVKLMREQARIAALNELGGLLQICADSDTCRDYIGRMNGLLSQRSGVRFVNMEQGLTDFYERHRAEHTYLSWGLDKLDDKLYVESGDYVVLGGYSSAGKTALALMFAWHMASHGKKVGFFSLETNNRKLHDRLISSVAKMDFGKIKRSDLTDEDYEALALMSKRLIAPTLELVDAACMSVTDIQAFSLSRGYEIVFIDYLQIIKSSGQNTTEAVSKISIGLHQFSQGSGVTVVALSQLSRPEKTNEKAKVPNMHSLRESGQIEQDADVVMLLYKEEPDLPNSRRVLKIGKNKEGELGQIFLAFDGPTQTFRESMQDAPAPATKRGPEYRQVAFRELPGNDPDLPF